MAKRTTKKKTTKKPATNTPATDPVDDQQPSTDASDTAAKPDAKPEAESPAPGTRIYISRHRNFTAGKHDFSNGRLETSDPKVIKELEAHPAFGTRFLRSDDAA